MIDLADIERVADLAKRYLSERKKYERLSEKSLIGVMTPKQAQKSSTDLNWQAMVLLKLEASLHASCVDAGCADLREPHEYHDRVLRPDGWHEYPFTPPKPRALKGIQP